MWHRSALRCLGPDVGTRAEAPGAERERCQSRSQVRVPPQELPAHRPRRRLGRMWWQLQLGGQDVGVGADERSLTAVPPPAPASTPSGSRALSLGTEGLFPIFRGRTSQPVAMDLSCITPFSGPPSPA